ncbi:UV radiation resistance protein (UVRAG), putative [Talaromyces stipitatus ATCC 10500]|uniref:Autophagy-related protein 14 n=1 Tax=Talaromyces stipitatus (strain ATCC 10500 / CBS 375.48 / QM 6759 / NRRL 1006) TaxID=441959 RepID=B8LYE2_TALSN|nr:UV radiation resistance protein (UVRAG), putative [Talaromyces stipitatus ATCC 10500]EED22871.1 UV radiation resistance protein (UVRAG), putative [Talaromyces stipitatus ATCC 10500]
MADSHDNGRRERPLLFSVNRKLRHVQSLSIRNLSITPPNRARGKTIDDDDIPYALETPVKLASQAQNRSIIQSRSYTDLKSASSQKQPVNGEQEQDDKRVKESRRMRRRSTLPWSGGNLESRQTKLEDIARSRMADVWFSIHCDGIDSPVYISEVVERTTNPDFRVLDLNVCGPHVSRMDQLTVKVWVKSENMNDYTLLLELHLSLRSLQFVGKSLETFHHPLPPNCVLFHFADGVFTNLTDFPPSQTNFSSFSSEKSQAETQSTSSYDALMRLANLDDCIQDALATREKLESQINAILKKHQKNLELLCQVSQAEERAALIKRSLANEKKQVRWTAKRKDELIDSLKTRRESMALGRENQNKIRTHLSDAQLKLSSSASLLEQNQEDTKGQIRRICEDLLTIYPIEPISDKVLAFTIAGLYLPNSRFDDIDRESVAAALGYIGHLVYLLSFYLSVPLPYPLKPYMSSTYIQDPVSSGLSRRTFPLYPVNVQYRFEYGVFLLNKNIEVVMNRFGLRVLDIRHTLPNLKYLLYVLTARTNELPARKAGGVRGLLLGRGTPTMSRQNSQDSFASSEIIMPHRMPSEVHTQATIANNDASKGQSSYLGKQSFLTPVMPGTATEVGNVR